MPRLRPTLNSCWPIPNTTGVRVPLGDRGGGWADEPRLSDVGMMLVGALRRGDRPADDSDDRPRTRNPHLTSRPSAAHSAPIRQHFNGVLYTDPTKSRRVMHHCGFSLHGTNVAQFVTIRLGTGRDPERRLSRPEEPPS